MNSPNRLAKIETLFHEALEHEPAERAAFLAEACADDPSLLDAVNALLAAHDQSFSLLDQRHAGAEYEGASAPTKNLPGAPPQQPVPRPVSHSSRDGQRERQRTTTASYALGGWDGDLTITRERYEQGLNVFLHSGKISRRYSYEDTVVHPPEG